MPLCVGMTLVETEAAALDSSTALVAVVLSGRFEVAVAPPIDCPSLFVVSVGATDAF